MPEHYHKPSPIEPADGRPHIFVAVPAINLYPSHVSSMIEAIPHAMFYGVAVDYFLLANHCHVDDARNTCIGFFLETKCDALIFVDADIGFPKEALLRLAVHKGDVVAGVYPRRDPSRTYPFTWEGDTLAEGDENGVIRKGITGLPAGFMKIHRRVLAGMADLEPRFFHAAGDGENGPRCPVIFERMSRGISDRLSGDYTFCQKAKGLGFELALDPHIPFLHEGPWRFGGRLADDMRPKPDVTNGSADKDAA